MARVRESQTYQIWLRPRGQITLPAPIRKRLRLREGTPLTAFVFGQSVVVTGKPLLGPGLIRDVEQAMEEEGLTLAELLSALMEERKRYSREVW